MSDVLSRFVAEKGAAVLDGGTASELQMNGFDLNNELWSAAALKSDPQALIRVHQSFINAGADIITGAAYQASVDGFIRIFGVDQIEAESLFELSVELARKACESDLSRKRLIAAGTGPYAIIQGNGSDLYRDLFT
jgi:homocysteine S-methyltransferase